MRPHKLRVEWQWGRKHCPAARLAGFHTVSCAWQLPTSFTQQPTAGKGKICVEEPSAYPGFICMLLLQGCCTCVTGLGQRALSEPQGQGCLCQCPSSRLSQELLPHMSCNWRNTEASHTVNVHPSAKVTVGVIIIIRIKSSPFSFITFYGQWLCTMSTSELFIWGTIAAPGDEDVC